MYKMATLKYVKEERNRKFEIDFV